MKENACFNVKCLKTLLFVIIFLFWVSNIVIFRHNAVFAVFSWDGLLNDVEECIISL